MFKQIKSFIDSKKIRNAIDKTKENVLKRSEEIDFDLLGRSLSCNPYLPRGLDSIYESNLDSIHNEKLQTKIINSIQEAEGIESKIIAINTTLKNDLSLISNIRRYSPKLIIHYDLFISKYQILESAVYGSDAIILNSQILDRNSFLTLHNFATRLGLSVIAQIYNEKELEMYMNLDIAFFRLMNEINNEKLNIEENRKIIIK